MKLAIGMMVAFAIVSLYQINIYSRGYHGLAIAHEVNMEAITAQGLQITFLQDEVQRQRQLNIDMANEVDNANGVAETMFVAGCTGAGKTKIKCLRMQSKYRTGAQ